MFFLPKRIKSRLVILLPSCNIVKFKFEVNIEYIAFLHTLESFTAIFIQDFGDFNFFTVVFTVMLRLNAWGVY